MALARFNPSIPEFPKRATNPRRGKHRRKNPMGYTRAAADVLGAPILGAGLGAIAGLVVASVAKPEQIRYAAALGAILGLGVVGVMEVDSRAHGGA